MDNKKPNLNIDQINELLNIQINYCKEIQQFMIDNKCKIRKCNFPEIISESIIKICIENQNKNIKCNIKQTWGDLEIIENKIKKNIEVKCFTSKGPMSFGPTEKWDQLYILDATKFINKKFKIYRIKLSNNSNIFSNIRVNATQNYLDQCNQKRRPRITFDELKKQLNNYVELFDGELIFI